MLYYFQYKPAVLNMKLKFTKISHYFSNYATDCNEN